MKVIRHTDADFAARLAEVTAPSSLFDPVIEQRTRAIVDAVRERGDGALLEFTERFDGAQLNAEQLPVTQAEFMNAALVADDALRDAVALAHKNIAALPAAPELAVIATPADTVAGIVAARYSGSNACTYRWASIWASSGRTRSSSSITRSAHVRMSRRTVCSSAAISTLGRPSVRGATNSTAN